MPAVTQRIDDYLGGVSRQSDDKKLPGQVVECINGYPDPTFGLTKRPGFQHLGNLGTGTTYDNSKWFFISRTETEKYIGCITPASTNPVATGSIAIWNAATFAPCNVYFDALPWAASTSYAVGDLVQNDSGKVYQCDTAGTSASSGGPTGTGANISDNSARWDYLHSGQAQAYLTSLSRTNYDILTVQDKSIITNKTKVAAITANPQFDANRQGTIKLTGVSTATKYNVSVAGQPITEYTSANDATYDDVLTELKSRIDGLSISNLTVTKLKDALHLARTGASFTLTGTGGPYKAQLQVFQDQVPTIDKLPAESIHDHVVKIINSGALLSSYFLKYVSEGGAGTTGAGFWTEALGHGMSTGLDPASMPHELENTAVNTFVFQRIQWTARAVGDDTTNSHPSFIDSKIQQSFFHNNRLGFLAEDTVSMSQAGDFFNMYHTSAQTVTDADPIDISASTVKPVALHSVIPSTQGLVLFSANQQFLMGAADGILTPAKTVIRTIASYEMDTVIDPVDTGTTINFISKTPSYTRIFAMITRGENENPQVEDIGRIVNEWVPSTVDTLISSPQNQFIAFSGQSSKYIYFFRSYTEGKTVKLASWFNWLAPGNVQTIAADSDEFFAVTKQAGQFILSKASLSQSPEDAIIVNNDGQRLNPCVDLYATASSVSFDTAGNFSKCFIPYNDATDLKPVIVIKGTTATGQFIESGFTISPERVVESGNTYFKVPGKNLTSVASDVIVGYKFDFDVILPKTYYKIDDEMKRSDFTANLTIARMKFAVGLSGMMAFKLKSKGIRQGKRVYTADGTTTDYPWIDDNINYIDDNQIKVKLNNVETTAFTVDRTGALPKITLNSASSELKTFSGNGSLKTFDLTFVPNNHSIIKVKIGGVETTDFDIVDQFIHFDTAPASGTNNILVYSADEIIIYIDEWYNLNPVIMADNYLANDIPVSDQTIFTLPIHQKTDNFSLRLFNDSPFPVSLNSMMWEGTYSPRFYRRT